MELAQDQLPLASAAIYQARNRAEATELQRVVKNYGLSNAETEALDEEYMDYCARGCVL